jgi:hypothetical protein
MSTNRFSPCAHRERGAVNLIAVTLLFAVIMAMLGSIMLMTATDITDSHQQSQSVQALLLAESGVERAMGRLRLGGIAACTNAGLAETGVVQGPGTISIAAPTVAGANCQFQASGSIGNVRRTLNVLATAPAGGGGGGSIALELAVSVPNSTSNTAVNSRTVSIAIGGVNRVLVVGVTTDSSTATTVTGVTYAGQSLTFRVGSNPTPSTGSRPRTEIWSMRNPPVGTANLVVTLSNADQLVVGALVFSGADTSTANSHVDATGSNSSGTSADGTTNSSVQITPVTAGAWIVDVVAVNGGDRNDTVLLGTPARTLRWNRELGESITGAGASLGPVSPAVLTTLRWTWLGTEKWSQAALALRPGNTLPADGASTVLTWTEAVTP